MHFSFKRLFILSLLINILFLAKIFYVHFLKPPISKIQAELDDRRSQSRVSTLNLLPIDSGDLVFVGTSITEGFPVTELFHSLKVKNRGIGGNETRFILEYIEKIAKKKPAKIFLEIGVNDLKIQVPVDTVFDRYRRIIDIIGKASPGTEVIVQSTLSTSPPIDEIAELNRRLSEWCHNKKITYVDLYSALCKDGALDTAFTPDGIHLNAGAYTIWKDKIGPMVK
jgi:lysophospholipase L1-like esterase